MNLFQKITNAFNVKSAAPGGFEVLSRLVAGPWNKTKMLEQYEKSLYVFACCSKIAEKVASIPPQLYQIINSDGDTKEILNHPLLNLLYKPNPFQTRVKFLTILVLNLKLSGDAFIYKVRNSQGKVAELWNLRPDMMTIVKSPTDFIAGYIFTKEDGTQITMQKQDVIHFKKPSPIDDYYGVSPIKSAQVRIDTEAYASNYQRNFFLNSARPDAAVSTEQTLTDAQKKDLRFSFERRHRGSRNAGRLAIFEGGLKYQQLSLSQREMDFIESMKFTRDDILVAFSVPKPIVAVTDDVNRANAETAMTIFLRENIKPEADGMWDTFNEDLVVPDFGQNLFIDIKDPTPANREEQIKEYDSGLTQGWLLINEVRQRENLPPIDGGDVLYKPLGVQPVGGLSKADKSLARKSFFEKINQEANDRKIRIFCGREELRLRLQLSEQLKKEISKTSKNLKQKNIKTSKKSDKELISLISDNTLREKYVIMVLKKIDKETGVFKKDLLSLADDQHKDLIKMLEKQSEIKKNLTKAMSDKLKKSIDKFYKNDVGLWAEFSLPFITTFAENAGKNAMDILDSDQEFEINDRIANSLQARAKEFGLGVNDTTRDKITSAISQGLEAGEGMTEISDRISEIYKEFPTWRADLIARTESTAANGEGTMEGYKQSEVATHKEWIATQDDRTRDEHLAMDGEIVLLNDNFSNGLPYPQEPNCRCVLAPAFEK